MFGFGKKNRTRDAPSYKALWLAGEEDGNKILPGYVPLSCQPDVMQCIDKIADPVSNMTIKLMENGENGDVRIKDELAKKIDVSPSRFMNRKNFIYRIASDMCYFGNAVVVPHYRYDYLDDLELLNASECSYIKTNTDSTYKIRYRGVLYDADEVLHFVFIPDKNEPYRGVGFTEMIKQAVDNLLQANATKKGFLQSKWKPSLVISIDSDIEELRDPQMRKNILGSYVSETERGEPWLIPAGQLDIKTIQPLTLKDLAVQESIELDKKVLAAATGVPPFMVGVGNFNKDEYNHFIATKIMSFGHIIEQELTSKLLLSPKRYFVFSPKSLLQYSLTEKVGFVKEMVSGGMLNRNEGRVEMGYTPVDKNGMNDYIVLENYVPVDRVGDQKKLNNTVVKDGDNDGTMPPAE